MNRQEIELDIGLQLPVTFEKYSPEVQELVINYIKSLDKIERQAYTIGKSHLCSSFNLLKSNGFVDWAKNNK